MSDIPEQGSKPIFRPLSADDPDPETTVIESLCMNCEKNGTTLLLLTKIPFYKEVILMSFQCDYCGYQNNEIQSGGKIEDKGVRITVSVQSAVDLNRQVVKSDFTSIRIPELDFEIPSRSQKGEITTIEGVIDRSIQGLSDSQSMRREQDPDFAEKVDAFLVKLKDLKVGTTPFTMVIEDISGNCFVSNPKAPLKDTAVVITPFVRSEEQDKILGIYDHESTQEEVNDVEDGIIPPVSTDDYSYDKLVGEIMQFPTNCSSCCAPCETNMKMTNIPYFKEVVIMATNCEACGHRSNEIKSGGGIEPQGIRLELKIAKPEDLTRDVLKSDTCQLEIPEIQLEVGPTTLGGRFTTVEGLLCVMKEQLNESGVMFYDSQDNETKKRYKDFLKEVDRILDGSLAVTLILDDPAGNSYVQKMTGESVPDPGLIVTKYERNFEQNEDLGLNDMKTENYETDS